MVPPCSDRMARVPPYSRTCDPGFPYGAVTRYGPPFQTLPVPKTQATGLVRVRSPLLTESRLMSFPPATEMFQFAGFASRTLWIQMRIPSAGGLPHSEIPGSTIARISPGLFAACHVLHRLSVPRHPPDALTLRLSATPNGKDHPMTAHREQADRGRQSTDPATPAEPRATAKLSSQKTLCRGSPARHRRHSSQAAGRARSPATVTQLASLRLSISNMPRPPQAVPKQFLALLARVSAAPAPSAPR